MIEVNQTDLLAHIKASVLAMDRVFEALEDEYDRLKLLWEDLTPSQRLELEQEGVSVDVSDPQDD